LIKLFFAKKGHLPWLQADILEGSSVPLFPYIQPVVANETIELSSERANDLHSAFAPVAMQGTI
jgi:hypothetical protein